MCTQVIRHVADDDNKGCSRREYGIWYLCLFGGSFVLSFFIAFAAPRVPYLATLTKIVEVVVCIISFVLLCERLNNIGHSGWWALLVIVPIVNIFLLVYCLACPKDFKYTKRFDSTGVIIASVVSAILIIMLLLVLVGVFITLSSG